MTNVWTTWICQVLCRPWLLVKPSIDDWMMSSFHHPWKHWPLAIVSIKVWKTWTFQKAFNIWVSVSISTNLCRFLGRKTFKLWHWIICSIKVWKMWIFHVTWIYLVGDVFLFYHGTSPVFTTIWENTFYFFQASHQQIFQVIFKVWPWAVSLIVPYDVWRFQRRWKSWRWAEISTNHWKMWPFQSALAINDNITYTPEI